MCVYNAPYKSVLFNNLTPQRRYIPAREYFSEAKKRTAHLKTLKSVSRAYRKLAVRDLKQKAIEQREMESYISRSNSRDDI
jgi:hypothetical protein